MAKQNNQNPSSVDIAVHKVLDFDIRSKAIAGINGKDIIEIAVEEDKSIAKKEYANVLKSIVKEGKSLEIEVKKMRSTPDIPESVNPESGQVSPARVSKAYYDKIKSKVARINTIVGVIEDLKAGKLESLIKIAKSNNNA